MYHFCIMVYMYHKNYLFLFKHFDFPRLYIYTTSRAVALYCLTVYIYTIFCFLNIDKPACLLMSGPGMLTATHACHDRLGKGQHNRVGVAAPKRQTVVISDSNIHNHRYIHTGQACLTSQSGARGRACEEKEAKPTLSSKFRATGRKSTWPEVGREGGLEAASAGQEREGGDGSSVSPSSPGVNTQTHRLSQCCLALPRCKQCLRVCDAPK